MTEPRRPRVLLLADDGDTAKLLIEILENEGFEPIAAESHTTDDAICVLRPRLIVVDPAGNVFDRGTVPDAVRHCGFADVPVLLLSAALDLAGHAYAVGATAYLAKPFEIDEFAQVCRSLSA